ncbi:MAG TPA: RNA polymerase sigma factor [Planctomycetota bacterium]|nr:RNA polymerase sigma factor [Planctomycetota bacterium]
MPTTAMMVDELIRMREQPGGAPLDQFWRLAERFRADLVNQAFVILGTQDDAEDVAQETLSHAFLHLAQLRDPEKIGAWLRGINRNMAFNLRRRRARDREERLSTAQMSALEAPERKSTGPYGGVDAVMRAVDKLPAIYREVLVLRYWEKLSAEAIAERLNLPIATIWTRMSRADLALAEKLQTMLRQEKHQK